MNAERLLAHYEKIADAPDAIARLRRFILDLAVRGKLVPQDAKDEPASELLKRIAKEKARLVKAGELRKPRDLDSGNDLNEPFPIPATWRWVRLDAVGAIVGGGTPSAADPDNFTEPGEGVPWLTPADLGGYSDLYISRGSRDLSEKGSRASSATVMPKSTVLFTSRAPIGYVAIAANPISTNQGFKSIVPYILDCSRFVATAMKAFAPEIDAKAPGTTFKEVSGKIVAATSFPLPPLTEQHRIVAKVDELMGLCDGLAAARAGREAVRDRLAAASLARLNAPDAHTFQADARFALDVLPALTARPDQIKTLRQTILNLAVRGRLTSNDLNWNLEREFEQLKNVRLALCQNKSDLAKINSEFDEIEAEWRTNGKDLSTISTVCACHFITKGTTPSPNELLPTGEVPFLKVYNIVNNKLDFKYRPTFISRKVHEGALSRSIVRPDDIIMNIVGPPLGKVALVTDEYNEWNINQALAFFRPLPTFSNHFMALVLTAPVTIQGVLKETRGTVGQDNLSLEQVRHLRVPFIPLAEQHRIVARVDALMALCDQLEASLTTTAATRRRLLDALLAEVLAPADARELEAAE